MKSSYFYQLCLLQLLSLRICWLSIYYTFMILANEWFVILSVVSVLYLIDAAGASTACWIYFYPAITLSGCNSLALSNTIVRPMCNVHLSSVGGYGSAGRFDRNNAGTILFVSSISSSRGQPSFSIKRRHRFSNISSHVVIQLFLSSASTRADTRRHQQINRRKCRYTIPPADRSRVFVFFYPCTNLGDGAVSSNARPNPIMLLRTIVKCDAAAFALLLLLPSLLLLLLLLACVCCQCFFR